MFNYARRREALVEGMAEANIDALFLHPSADLEYLTGLERTIPNFGNVSYAHGWITGAFLVPGQEPIFVLPRMYATFDLPSGTPGDLMVVNETDDGEAVLKRVIETMGPIRTLGVGDRVWAETVLHLAAAAGSPRLVNASPLVNALRRVKSPEEIAIMERACAIVDGTMEATAARMKAGVTVNDLVEEVEHQMRIRGSRTPSFTTHIFTGGLADVRESHQPSGDLPVRRGESVLFDFGAVLDGYCSDFGRTIFVGEPTAEYRRAYEVMLAAQEMGRKALIPGTTVAEVNRQCRAPIEEAGYGSYFRHRMGHGIGLDVHERPFLSEEDQTALEAGMTFTDEPSIIWQGRVAVRIENIVVCEESGGRRLNIYPLDLVAST
jgi:Xaa-Pro aminopeptidase